MQENSELVGLLRELVQLTRVSSRESIRAALLAVLNTPKKLHAYSLADGTRGVQEIRQEASMSPNSVTALFKSCELFGLMSTDATGKRTALFDLDAYGIQLDIDLAGEAKP